jgi:alkylated DNA repair dioxygenase AlkB
MASASAPRFVKKREGEDGEGTRAKNDAVRFARGALRSEAAMVDGRLLADFESVLSGNAIYLQNFHASARDYSVLANLAREMERAAELGGMVNWSKHLKHENPDFSETFQRVVDAMADYFDVEVYATRMNFYRDGTDWKPFHHDSHAYGGRAQREDFTMGASFGGSRELIFLHEPSGNTFTFPQNNGDVFAFTSEVNKRFKHGVPKAKSNNDPRFSIIAWGRRRSINSRNGGGKVTETTREATNDAENAETTSEKSCEITKPHNELVTGNGEVSQLIRQFFEKQATIESNQRGSAKRDSQPTRGKAPETSAKLALEAMHRIGETAYMELRTAARDFQEGHIPIKSFYARAYELCDGEMEILLGLATYLPDTARKEELLRFHDTATCLDI